MAACKELTVELAMFYPELYEDEDSKKKEEEAEMMKEKSTSTEDDLLKKKRYEEQKWQIVMMQAESFSHYDDHGRKKDMATQTEKPERQNKAIQTAKKRVRFQQPMTLEEIEKQQEVAYKWTKNYRWFMKKRKDFVMQDRYNYWQNHEKRLKETKDRRKAKVKRWMLDEIIQGLEDYRWVNNYNKFERKIGQYKRERERQESERKKNALEENKEKRQQKIEDWREAKEIEQEYFMMQKYRVYRQRLETITEEEEEEEEEPGEAEEEQKEVEEPQLNMENDIPVEKKRRGSKFVRFLKGIFCCCCKSKVED